ncbi:unnamed protein product [Fusarium graminearum]|nr:unnamed protein product [Fusarium graminearum]CAG2002637.1 unnamed protein product [Fusarium graminearum]CAG2003318.1 unnamed protein product [Fusarium graminearum]VTO92276.1 unnamed protein product [Fusarium graminearum]
MVLSDVRVPSHLPLLLLSRFPSVAYSSDYLDGRSSHYNQGMLYGSNKTNRRVPTGASSFRASWSALVRILVSGPTRCQGSAAGFTWKLSAESSKGPDYETVQLQNFRSINYVAFSEAQERGMSLQLTVRGLHANYR